MSDFYRLEGETEEEYQAAMERSKRRRRGERNRLLLGILIIVLQAGAVLFGMFFAYLMLCHC